MRRKALAARGRPAASGEALDALLEAVEAYDEAVLLTQRPGGLARARPLFLDGAPDSPELWAPASRQAERGSGLLDGTATAAVCCYGGADGWLSLSVRARPDGDPEAVARRWKPEWRLLHPGGPEDRDLVLLRLAVLRAERWDPVRAELRVLVSPAPSPRPTEHLTAPT